MEKLIYVDTNIYIDFFEDRKDKLRPLGEFAFQMIKRTLGCEFKIIISNLVVDELHLNDFGEKTADIIKDLKAAGKVKFVYIKNSERRIVRKIVRERKTSFNDTAHAFLSNKAAADYLVTRNIKDFVELQDLVNLKLPENL